jgi:hypothetical protein
MVEPQFECKIEELPFLARITVDNFTADQAEFIKFSPDYDEDHLKKAEAQIEKVGDVVAPEKLMGEKKKITQDIMDDYTHGRNLVNKLERFIDRAADAGLALTMLPKDFGVKKVRDNINLKNDEGAVLALKALKGNVDANKAVLESKGYRADVQKELSDLVIKLESDSKAQTRKQKEWEDLIKANMGEFNALWEIVSDILKTGKTIYKEKDKTKVKDYTYADLINDVRIKRKKQEEENGGGTPKK